MWALSGRVLRRSYNGLELSWIRNIYYTYEERCWNNERQNSYVTNLNTEKRGKLKMNVIITLMDLYEPNDMLIMTQQTTLKNYKFYFPNMTPPAQSPNDKYYTILPDGSLSKVSNIKLFTKNKETILDMSLNSYQESLGTDLNELESLLKTLIQEKKDALENEDYLSFVSYSVQITSLYILTEGKIEHILENEDELDKVFTSIGELGEEEDVTNELDMLNSLLRNNFSLEELQSMEVLNSSYNGKEMDNDEIMDVLASHMLPEYITQIDIRDTVEDTYTIETSICTIIREKDTMNIRILKKED